MRQIGEKNVPAGALFFGLRPGRLDPRLAKMGPQYYRLRGQVPYGILSYLAYDNAHHMLILYKGTHTDLYR